MSDFLMAEAAIRQLHARYIDAVWRKDADAFGECFTNDAQWKIAGLHARGRDGLRTQFEKLISPSERVLMFVGLPILEITAATAVGRVHVTEYVKRKDGSAMRTIGVYYDRYAGEDDRWYFRLRHFELYYRGAPDFSAPFFDCPDYGPHPGMPAAL